MLSLPQSGQPFMRLPLETPKKHIYHIAFVTIYSLSLSTVLMLSISSNLDQCADVACNAQDLE